MSLTYALLENESEVGAGAPLAPAIASADRLDTVSGRQTISAVVTTTWEALKCTQKSSFLYRYNVYHLYTCIVVYVQYQYVTMYVRLHVCVCYVCVCTRGCVRECMIWKFVLVQTRNY